MSDLHPRYSTTAQAQHELFLAVFALRLDDAAKIARLAEAARRLGAGESLDPEDPIHAAVIRSMAAPPEPREGESVAGPDEALTETEALVALLDMATRTAYGLLKAERFGPRGGMKRVRSARG